MRFTETSLMVALCCLGAGCAAPPNSEPTSLAVSVARGPSGVLLTNREIEPVTRCDVTLRDPTDQMWASDDTEVIRPLQTIEIAWERFAARGETMPGYLGLQSATFSVSCLLADRTRRSASVRF